MRKTNFCLFQDHHPASTSSPQSEPDSKYHLIILSFDFLMDGEFSSLHRPRELVDLVDAEWFLDSLAPDDELDSIQHWNSNHLLMVEEMEASATAAAAAAAGHNADNPQATPSILTDREGANWVLSITKHNRSALNHSMSGLCNYNPHHELTHLLPGSGSTLTINSSNVESPDGLRWTDYALNGFARQANKQPNQ